MKRSYILTGTLGAGIIAGGLYFSGQEPKNSTVIPS